MIENWMIILGIANLVLFIVGILFFIPRQQRPPSITEFWRRFQNVLPLILIIILVVIIHLIEVNVIDPYTTQIAGNNYTPLIHGFEGDRVIWFSNHWIPPLVLFFVVIYIIIYPFTLWFTPFSFIFANEKKPMKIFTYGLLFIYAIALPFYLFLPITNVYTFYGLSSALNATIPSIETFFYSTTTQNNCFPSLHVAMTLLVTQTVFLTNYKKYKYFTAICTILVIVSVMYLAIHWITDVIGGIVLSIGVFLFLNHFIKEK